MILIKVAILAFPKRVGAPKSHHLGMSSLGNATLKKNWLRRLGQSNFKSQNVRLRFIPNAVLSREDDEITYKIVVVTRTTAFLPFPEEKF